MKVMQLSWKCNIIRQSLVVNIVLRLEPKPLAGYPLEKNCILSMAIDTVKVKQYYIQYNNNM